MKGLGNAEIFGRNLRMYLEQSGKLAKDVAAYVGVAPATFSEWVNGKKYPRMDKVEMLADYFGILKSDLIEIRTEEHREMQKKNDIMTDIVLRMRTDDDFLSAVESLYNMDDEKLSGLLTLLK